MQSRSEQPLITSVVKAEGFSAFVDVQLAL